MPAIPNDRQGSAQATGFRKIGAIALEGPPGQTDEHEEKNRGACPAGIRDCPGTSDKRTADEENGSRVANLASKQVTQTGQHSGQCRCETMGLARSGEARIHTPEPR